MKLNITDGDTDLLCQTKGPVWVDACNHEEGSYITSFEIYNFKAQKMDRYDLYLFKDNYHGQEVCIRYGNEGNEYISPGGLINFLGHQHDSYEPYQTACRILIHYGFVTWQVREKK
jgi:hypothetical protein